MWRKEAQKEKTCPWQIGAKPGSFNSCLHADVCLATKHLEFKPDSELTWMSLRQCTICMLQQYNMVYAISHWSFTCFLALCWNDDYQARHQTGNFWVLFACFFRSNWSASKCVKQWKYSLTLHICNMFWWHAFALRACYSGSPALSCLQALVVFLFLHSTYWTG